MLSSGRGFASDNNATVHPEILAAIARANVGHTVAYGDDPYTQRALALFRDRFGEGVQSFFVFNGTAANVLSLQSAARPHHAIICARTAHIQNDECGAPERWLGSKLLPVATPDGKLTPELVKAQLQGLGDVHHVQPHVVSLTQSTELGTVYSRDELRSLATLCHAQGMYLHMDGARLANAATFLGCGLREISGDCGVDVLSFGGTKNGLLLGEAVVFFDPGLARAFGFARKQSMQLASKMRFIAAQFEALLADDLWSRNATQANAMARRLEDGLRKLPELALTQPVQANAIFARVPASCVPRLQEKAFFYVWDPVPDGRDRIEVRWVCSFDTSVEDVDAFVDAVRTELRG